MKTLEYRDATPLKKEILNRDSLVITIDGSTTAGKRVVAEKLADRYGLSVLETGTTIRALALLAIENNLVQTDETNVTTVPVDFAEKIVDFYEHMPIKLTIEKPRSDERTARIMVGNRDMRGELFTFRKQKAIDNLSSMIAASDTLRKKLYGMWRSAVNELGGAVVIGRKTGVDLFPDAPIKLYFFASPQASAVYRVTHDPTATLRKTSEELYVRERDLWEQGKGLLERPHDALAIDTSEYIMNGQKGLNLLEGRIEDFIDSHFEIRGGQGRPHRGR